MKTLKLITAYNSIFNLDIIGVFLQNKSICHTIKRKKGHWPSQRMDELGKLGCKSVS